MLLLSYVWQNYTAMSIRLLVCGSVQSLRFLHVCSQYINYTVLLLCKQVVLADIAADVMQWCTRRCMAYDNQVLQFQCCLRALSYNKNVYKMRATNVSCKYYIQSKSIIISSHHKQKIGNREICCLHVKSFLVYKYFNYSIYDILNSLHHIISFDNYTNIVIILKIGKILYQMLTFVYFNGNYTLFLLLYTSYMFIIVYISSILKIG